MLLVWIPCTSLQNFSFPCNWIILRIHLWSSSSFSSFNKISQNDIYFKGWLRLFVDYVNSREKGQLQKSHYLSEFLRLREILNFFQQRISRMFIWNGPHRPAKLAKSAIFWMKETFFLKKLENDPNSSQIMSAGSGRCIKSWPGICSASPKATST